MAARICAGVVAPLRITIFYDLFTARRTRKRALREIALMFWRIRANEKSNFARRVVSAPKTAHRMRAIGRKITFNAIQNSICQKNVIRRIENGSRRNRIFESHANLAVHSSLYLVHLWSRAATEIVVAISRNGSQPRALGRKSCARLASATQKER